MKKVAFIPARSGSKRIKDKNIRILNGHPLIAYTIVSALKSQVFDNVYFSTDSSEYANVASYYGAETPFLRDKQISDDKSSDFEWVKFMIDKLSDRGEYYEVFSILRPTSPFRLEKTIKKAMRKFLSATNYDSLRAIEECSQHPGKMWVRSKESINPLLPFYNDKVPWHSSQYASLPKIYVQNASLEICWTKSFNKKKSISGDFIIPFDTVDYEGFDINNEEDFLLAEILIKKGLVTITDIMKKPYEFRQ